MYITLLCFKKYFLNISCKNCVEYFYFLEVYTVTLQAVVKSNLCFRVCV